MLSHLYGEHVLILDNPYLSHLLAKISSSETEQPTLTELIRKCYVGLLQEVCCRELDSAQIDLPTRMHPVQSEAILETNMFRKEHSCVVVDLARAGMVPAQTVYENLHDILPAKNLRQDHFYAARKTNEYNEVIGVDISGSKIGGDIQDKLLMFPDPMGATGGTICHAVSYYKQQVEGTPRSIISAHLIITPEYIQNIKKHHPEVKIFALRLDRALSSKKALAAKPGEFLSEERGLNANHYIVPGAGGIGELLNNSLD